MEYSELGIGNKINMLRIKDSTGVRTKPQQYVSQLLDLDVTKKYAKISMPIVNKMIVPLEIGDIYRIIIYTSNGLYQCMSRIEKRYKEGSLYMLDIQLMGKLEKYQRRQYFRLLCNFNVGHRIESEQETLLKELLIKNKFESKEERKLCQDELDSLVFTWNTGTVIDISGGGIRFNSSYEYKPDDLVIIKIPIAVDIDGNIREITTRVIHAVKKINGPVAVYDIRGEFVNIDNRIREKLVRYIFEEQRKRMKNN